METRALDIVLDGRRIVTARPIASGLWPGVVMLHEGWALMTYCAATRIGWHPPDISSVPRIYWARVPGCGA
jgi:hypothetical protein